MPSPADRVTMKMMTPTDISRWSRELVKAERTGRAKWALLAAEDKAGVVCFVREQLLRLLQDPSWIPGSLRPRDGSRLDVTISFDLSDAQSSLADAMFHNEQDLFDSLTALVAKHQESSPAPTATPTPTSPPPSSPSPPPSSPPTPSPPPSPSPPPTPPPSPPPTPFSTPSSPSSPSSTPPPTEGTL